MTNNTKQIPIVGFIAAQSNTGKTTLLLQVVEYLKAKGLRLVVIKHGRHFNVSDDNKDSSRYIAAGADMTAFMSPQGWQITSLSQEEPTLECLQKVLPQLMDLDLILVEGYKHGSYPKIEIMRAEVSRELCCPPEQLLAIVADCEPDVAYANLPLFDINDITAIGEFLLAYCQTDHSDWNFCY